MSNRYFSKNRKSYKKVFEIITPKRIHILEKLDKLIKEGNNEEFLSLLKSVETMGSIGMLRILETKKKLKL